MKIEDVFYDMLQAGDIDKLFSVYSTAVKESGYDQVLLALLSDHPRLQQSAQHGVLSSYPEKWVEYYLSQGYDQIDPVKLECKRHNLPFTWKQLREGKLSDRQRLLFNEADDADLHHGLGMPLHGPEGTSAGIGLAASCKGVSGDQQTLWTLYSLSVQFYANYWRLNENLAVQPSRITLTSRELEVLRWQAAGSTKAEIADKLNISYHTVDYHTRRILHKFKTRSVTAAVHFATMQGYIELE
jgi:DNA-binding CsgD family transcriptional regulator